MQDKNSFAITPHLQDKPMNQLVTTARTQSIVVSYDISKQWYEERSRQAKWSFNTAITLAIVAGSFGVLTAVSLSKGNITASVATATISLVSGVATRRSFDLFKEANQRLDEAAKTLLEE
ncbi:MULTISPECIES: TRADD-N-associated membrane domain-containing protein [Nostocales]|uniref:TRADD-N-associated membrane domain-containing protein n=1 Tax=Nostocales TaxID=1161 RepID=UPI0005EAC677|nr:MULTISPECIES: hypothetical protein [unclassified Tolypothrix]BAY28155.1 hypothetical protein NIES2100_79840 [Calothrix sp. NIES-2100]BAY96054.1 hypothetical protein NIES3275_81310 [Microchaete diplosiphon NIES-3275]EKE98236.1 hypothetical protein FDUTEX481_04254 [Tolypothrix sp. PCC 7601]MBE9085516.1 hypothetical protein [Tolypothrix sp. LEGE 11397]UYD31114.1 hypothetical protein HGR01_40265 [Tolypothrix sp. PCC 7712]